MKTKYIIQAAVIAAIYAVLTVALAPISYGVMQVRVSEALTILPLFTPAAIPGLFVGCLVSNTLGPYGLVDMICGSAASLLAAWCSRLLRGRPALVPLPPVLFNGVIIGGMLYFAYGIGVPLIPCMLWVALGQAISCYGLGYPLLRCLQKYRRIFE